LPIPEIVIHNKTSFEQKLQNGLIYKMFAYMKTVSF